MAWTENPADPMPWRSTSSRRRPCRRCRAPDAGSKPPRIERTHGRHPRRTAGACSASSSAPRARRSAPRATPPPNSRRNSRPPILDRTQPPLSIAGLPNLRIYVLGPPRDKAALRLEEKASEMLRALRPAGGSLARALAAGLAAGGAGNAGYIDDASPFDRNVGTELSALLAGSAEGDMAAFFGCALFGDAVPAQPGLAPTPGRVASLPTGTSQTSPGGASIRTGWRSPPTSPCSSIAASTTPASSWLSSSSTAARCSSFPGDAQIGNWLSWQAVKWQVDSATVEESRPDGAHGLSEGRPSRQPECDAGKAGLDLMTSSDLSAFIPTKSEGCAEGRLGQDALPSHPDRTRRQDERPRHPRRRQMGGRKGRQAGFTCPSGSIRAVRNAVRDTARGKGGLWVEVDLA